LSKEEKHITVFEHQTLRTDEGVQKLSNKQLKALQRYYNEKGVPFFSLCYNGVRFNEYVGVLKVGYTVIEVLPKADKSFVDEDDKDKWRKRLIGMLKAVGSFDITSTSSSDLRIQPNTILDLYIEMFIKEVEYILHSGLVKKYRKKKENAFYLRGNILFANHLQQNLVHKERFFVTHTVYDIEHLLHFIIYKALRLLKQINTRASLSSRIGALLLFFPEMPDIKVNESTFNRLVFDRKTESYKKAIEIARLLLLQYHPDLSKGRNHVLALMFDMNKLWEKFVFTSLRKKMENKYRVIAQNSKDFWQPKTGYKTRIRPDIVISDEVSGKRVVLDTKWKNLHNCSPSVEDLRQMYVYHEFFEAEKVALIYPGDENQKNGGNYFDVLSGNISNKECSIITLNIQENIGKMQKNISDSIVEWINKIKP
jgi:5-methylcytosine-specific restriction enzyme subunit McrC